MSPDTIHKRSSCFFKRDSSDTIFDFYFDAEREITGNIDFYSYSGTYFISGSKSHATIFQNKESLNDLIRYKHNYDFFNPLTNFEKSEMSELDTSLLQFIGEEKTGSYTTFHYRYVPVEDGGGEIPVLKSEFNFWINKQDNIPIRYSVYYQVDLMGDTLDQYDEYTLSSYVLNNHSNDALKTPDSFIKKGISLKEYVPEGEDPVSGLTIGSKVPQWNFKTNKKTELSSENHSYELVLFDFYYQSCFPCLKAIPALNRLSKAYDLKGKGLLVVGVDNIDPVDERFYEFVKKKQISYSVAISPNQLSKDFKVSSYPTLFLMNKEGELLYSSEGYSEQLESELEKVITEQLKKAKLLK